jgi:hypothetical protein
MIVSDFVFPRPDEASTAKRLENPDDPGSGDEPNPGDDPASGGDRKEDDG